jgi:hypothetical protein
MNLILIMHGQGVADILGIKTGPLTAGLAKTTGRSTQVRTGTTKILFQIMGQVPEQQLKILCCGTKKNHVTAR